VANVLVVKLHEFILVPVLVSFISAISVFNYSSDKCRQSTVVCVIKVVCGSVGVALAIQTMRIRFDVTTLDIGATTLWDPWDASRNFTGRGNQGCLIPSNFWD